MGYWTRPAFFWCLIFHPMVTTTIFFGFTKYLFKDLFKLFSCESCLNKFLTVVSGSMLAVSELALVIGKIAGVLKVVNISLIELI